MTKSIMLVGVGGQGTILASKLLTIGLMQDGYDVKMSEIHGMSQRGGSVSSQIRYSKDKVYSPVIEIGGADMIVSFEKVEEFNARGAGVKPGAFGENLLVEGWDLKTIPVGTKFRCNDVLLEITQIGKECHHGCEIFQKMGDCIMPRNGIFARVLEGGKIKPGDQIEIVE